MRSINFHYHFMTLCQDGNQEGTGVLGSIEASMLRQRCTAGYLISRLIDPLMALSLKLCVYFGQNGRFSLLCECVCLALLCFSCPRHLSLKWRTACGSVGCSLLALGVQFWMRQLSSFTRYNIFLEQTSPYRTELFIIRVLSNVFSRRSSITREESQLFMVPTCAPTAECLSVSMLLGSIENSYDFSCVRRASMVVQRSEQTFSMSLRGICKTLVELALALAQSSLWLMRLLSSKRPNILPRSKEATSYTFSPSSFNIFTCPSNKQYSASTSSPRRQAKELKARACTSHLSRNASFSALFMLAITGSSRKYSCQRMRTVLLAITYRVSSSPEACSPFSKSHTQSGMGLPARNTIVSCSPSALVTVMGASWLGTQKYRGQRQQGT